MEINAQHCYCNTFYDGNNTTESLNTETQLGYDDKRLSPGHTSGRLAIP
jgi:hypothetical protein